MRCSACFLLILALLMPCLPSCESAKSANQEIKDRDFANHEIKDQDFNHHAPLTAAVRKADAVTLYEGLPHQLFEKEKLAEELRTKKTVRFHGYPFYQEPLRLKEADAKQLTELFCNPKSFKPMRPGTIKACGGFHPDYCIEWRIGDKVCRALICFGCGEMKACDHAHELYCDITDLAGPRLLQTLKPYYKNRPKPTSGELMDRSSP